MLLPSQTERGAAWLANFETEDRDTARLLLDSLRIASSEEVRSGLETLVRERVEQRPAALIPVRSIEDVHVALHREDPLPKEAPNSAQLIAYRDGFFPDLPISATPGSEGLVGNLVRTLTGIRPSSEGDWIAPSQATLTELRDRRCRSLVFVTDYIGSGRQAIDYINAYLRHPTIRSWRSYGLIKIVVVSFAQTEAASTDLASVADECHFMETAPTIYSSGWDTQTITTVEELCKRYAKGRKREALGYGQTGGLFLSTISSAPNNLPWVLRREGGKWSDFLSGRKIPEDVSSQLGKYKPIADLSVVARDTGARRLARAIELRHRRASREPLIVLATCYQSRPANADEICHATRLSSESVHTIIRFLQGCGFVDDRLRLTQAGLKELRYAKQVRRWAPARPPADPAEPYYPQKMR